MQEKLLTNMKLKQICFAQTLSVILLAGMSSCSKDPGLNEPDPKPSTTTLWIDGEADTNQTWMTSVSMQLDLSVKGEGMLTAQTIGDNVPVVLGKKQVHDNDVMLIDVPQGIGSFGLVFDNGSVSKQYQCIRLSGDLHQLEKVSFDGTSTQAFSRQMAPAARAATNNGLYGSSIVSDEGYLNLGSWAWSDIAFALVESQNASIKQTALIDYEIMARGSIAAGGEYTSDEDVYISFIYGYTGTTASRVLGYYTHSAGSYSDIEYHDISEAIYYDYLNRNAKVQYQLDGNTGTWYDANFDYKDGDGLPNITYSQAADNRRHNDDAYNTLLVKQAYGDQIRAVRGLTFKITVPNGKKFGFYLKTNASLSPDQRNRLINDVGVPADKLPTNQLNFSYAPMNNGGKHRSAFAIYDNFTFMGLDDSADNGGDLDCNDVTFVLSNAKGGQYRPQFTEETLNSGLNQGTIEKNPIYTTPGETGTENLQSWILAFENAGTDVDFDFNDVVLQVVPNTADHTVAVYLLATGAERDTYIYYDNVLLGEAHQLFDVSAGQMVNTKLNGLRRDRVLLSDDLSWPDGYTMDANRHLFSIKVTGEDGNPITINSNAMLGEKHDIPQVLCVADEWNWPLEHQNVEQAYPLLGSWGRNVYKPEYWNWYSHPDHEYVFDYWK